MVGWTCCWLALKLLAPAMPDTRLTDAELYAALDLARPELAAVREAVDRGDLAAAQAALAAHFRSRQEPRLFPIGGPADAADRAKQVEAGQRLLRHEAFGPEYWTSATELDWLRNPDHQSMARMYFWTTLAQAYAADRDPALARLWVGLLRSFVAQCPAFDNGRYWNAMHAGIRLRDGLPRCLEVFRRDRQVTDRDLILYLKSVLEHVATVRTKHFATGNQLTFAMHGLLTAALSYPEFREAETWREEAFQKSVDDLDRGYLPDGMGVELSPGYHGFFASYLKMVELAGQAGHVDDPRLAALRAGCERCFDVYVRLAAPDRSLPSYQDGQATNAREKLAAALPLYPERGDYRWLATDGREGAPPPYTSTALPYAGYVALRSGWSTDACYLGFDVGPIGWRHAHQDKLSVVLWSYGRPVLIDPGRAEYTREPLSVYAADTFAHNTALVDGRPQRRRWSTPDPSQMPYQPLRDYRFATTPEWDHAAGVYDGAYGLAGPSDSYPYEAGGNFREGWVSPAVHHRRVGYLKPDLFVVADTLRPTDAVEHTFELRWHLGTTQVADLADGALRTTDHGRPNLLVAPLVTGGLTTAHASGQREPEVLGWWFHPPGRADPATTALHRRRGAGEVSFVTLLLPLRAGESTTVAGVEPSGPGRYRVSLTDGRQLLVEAPADPARDLRVTRVE